jgi:hypothetical protein
MNASTLRRAKLIAVLRTALDAIALQIEEEKEQLQEGVGDSSLSETAEVVDESLLPSLLEAEKQIKDLIKKIR